jgi:GT2 family glycosyltransferase
MPAVPELSIVIPTLNRAQVLRQALDRLDAQDGAEGRFDVVVVADAGDRDPDAVERAAAGRARVLRARAPGASAARNAGWRAATAPLVLFLGDDILAEPRLVAEHLAWHGRHPEREVAVLGDVRWADSLKSTVFMRWLDRGWQFDYDAVRAAGAGADVGWGRFYTANVSLKRELLADAGGFDEAFPFLSEDIELARRLHDLGLRVLYHPAARAEHLHEPTLEGWRERMGVAARAEHRLHVKHPDIPPYFMPRMRDAVEAPAPRGLGARLAPLVGPDTPWLGPRVWASVDARFRRALAPAFLAEWQRAESELPEQAIWERSRARWRAAKPDARLTWGAEIGGDAFIEAAAGRGVFGDGHSIVEIGPGYGRLLRSALAHGVGFARWTGVDLSPDNVDQLRALFAEDARVAFVNADAEDVRLDHPIDGLVSSLTFKHMYPTFEKALVNLAGQMRTGAVAAIDLIEGERAYFEPDGVTYIRWYTREEVREIYERAGLELHAFEEVRHHPEVTRLLAVGVKR